MSDSVLSLPLPLLLLVHLHLLSYPHAAKPEYDHALFDPRTRGLRDRTRSMEDVSYFLVGLIASPSTLKNILPVYPCLQPSETLAFRTSLAKYLEALRHQAIFQKDKPAQGGWWKDVIVRKSILEECAGTRFERLIVALSTHALMSTSGHGSPTDSYNPHVYATRLTHALVARSEWRQRALLLVHRADELRTFRDQTQPISTSRFAHLSTLRLRALAGSRAHDACSAWPEPALKFTLHLAGLTAPASPSSTTPEERIQIPGEIPPQVLPVAAAHHPTHIRALKKGVFASLSAAKTKRGASADPEAPVVSRATAVFATQVDAGTRARRAMRDALAGIRAACTRARAQRHTRPHPRADAINLWHPTLPAGVDFQRAPAPDLLAEIMMSRPHLEGDLESRIEHIRRDRLSGYHVPKLEPEPEQLHTHTPPPVDSGAPTRTVTSIPRLKPKPTVQTGAPAPRRSIRRSLAAARHLDSDIWQLVQSARDVGGDRRESVERATPRGTRIYTSGHTHTRARGVKRACPVELSEPRVRLPSLGAGASLSDGKIEVDDDIDDDADDAAGWNGEEGRSMTLREMLLGAVLEEPAFDLLGERADGEEEEGSFEWA